MDSLTDDEYSVDYDEDENPTEGTYHIEQQRPSGLSPASAALIVQALQATTTDPNGQASSAAAAASATSAAYNLAPSSSGAAVALAAAAAEKPAPCGAAAAMTDAELDEFLEEDEPVHRSSHPAAGEAQLLQQSFGAAVVAGPVTVADERSDTRLPQQHALQTSNSTNRRHQDSEAAEALAPAFATLLTAPCAAAGSVTGSNSYASGSSAVGRGPQNTSGNNRASVVAQMAQAAADMAIDTDADEAEHTTQPVAAAAHTAAALDKAAIATMQLSGEEDYLDEAGLSSAEHSQPCWPAQQQQQQQQQQREPPAAAAAFAPAANAPAHPTGVANAPAFANSTNSSRRHSEQQQQEQYAAIIPTVLGELPPPLLQQQQGISTQLQQQQYYGPLCSPAPLASAAAASMAAQRAVGDVCSLYADGAAEQDNNAHGGRRRPASAGSRPAGWIQQKQQQGFMPQQQQSQQQQPPMIMPVQQWEVAVVTDWVEAIGLPQYRKKLLHHCIDGRLLLRLTDKQLRAELGIGPLGHRALLLEAVQALHTADLSSAAAAAAAGIAPEDYLQQLAPTTTTTCSSTGSSGSFLPGICTVSPAAAAAVMVAGCIAQRAAILLHQSRHGGGSSRSPKQAHLLMQPQQQQQQQQQVIEVPSGYSSICADGSCGGGMCYAGGSLGSSCGAAAAAVAGRGRSRPNSAPCRGRHSSCPAQQASSPGALGPAAGRISVYEQRSKLLFELGRAQARAAAVAGTAVQVSDVARLATKEVARLQGQLADLDHKNKLQVQHAAGTVDSRGQIPWQHVGPGTRAAHPHPESHARPWDPPHVDLTFQPRISRASQRIMSAARGEGGAGGFLERLGNDLKRRQINMQELERRYQPGAVAASTAADAKADAAELHMVAAFLSQRGLASIEVPQGKGSQLSLEAQAELDEQLNQMLEVEGAAKELGLTGSAQAEAQKVAILAARGRRKVAALAAVVHTQQFMDRYKADLSTRDSRLRDLQNSWFKQQGSKAGAGTPEQRDLGQAARWFQGLGWEEDDCEELLAALIQRACAYKTEKEKLHDLLKERQKVAAAVLLDSRTGVVATGTHGVDPAAAKPSINWQALPWRDDGLSSKMQRVLDAQATEAASVAAKAAAAKKPSAVYAALKAAGTLKQAAAANSLTGLAASDSSSSSSSSRSLLDHSVQLLAGIRWAGLDQLEAASGKDKALAVYRALRTQQFLEFTAADLAGREAKQRVIWQQFEASRRGKVVGKKELDDFYARLQADGDRRKAELEKARADKSDREAKALLGAAAASSYRRTNNNR